MVARSTANTAERVMGDVAEELTGRRLSVVRKPANTLHMWEEGQ
jgi:hypothetical protein